MVLFLFGAEVKKKCKTSDIFFDRLEISVNFPPRFSRAADSHNCHHWGTACSESCSCSSGVERILGKDEVGGSIPPTSSIAVMRFSSPIQQHLQTATSTQQLKRTTTYYGKRSIPTQQAPR